MVRVIARSAAFTLPHPTSILPLVPPTPTSVLPLKGRMRSDPTFLFKGKAGMGMGRKDRIGMGTQTETK